MLFFIIINIININIIFNNYYVIYYSKTRFRRLGETGEGLDFLLRL